MEGCPGINKAVLVRLQQPWTSVPLPSRLFIGEHQSSQTGELLPRNNTEAKLGSFWQTTRIQYLEQPIVSPWAFCCKSVAAVVDLTIHMSSLSPQLGSLLTLQLSRASAYIQTKPVIVRSIGVFIAQRRTVMCYCLQSRTGTSGGRWTSII